MKLKKIVIFGGSGFLGKYLCSELIKNKNYKIVNYDQKKFILKSKNFNFIKGNILDKKKINKVLKNSKIVINLSGLSDIEECRDNPLKSAKINILGNLNILNSCVDNKVNKFLYASSLYSFSDQGSFYKCTKLASEVYIKEYNKIYGIKYIVLRYGSIYGEGSNDKNGINRIFNSIIKKKKIIYNGNKSAERSYVHVEDVAKSTALIIKKNFDNSTIIIKGKKKFKIKDLLNSIKKLFHLKQRIQYGKNIMVAHYIKSPKNFEIPKIKNLYVKETKPFEKRLKKLMKYLTIRNKKINKITWIN